MQRVRSDPLCLVLAERDDDDLSSSDSDEDSKPQSKSGRRRHPSIGSDSDAYECEMAEGASDGGAGDDVELCFRLDAAA